MDKLMTFYSYSQMTSGLNHLFPQTETSWRKEHLVTIDRFLGRHWNIGCIGHMIIKPEQVQIFEPECPGQLHVNGNQFLPITDIVVRW